MFFRKILVFTTFEKDDPASSRMAFRFFITWWASSLVPPGTISPVWGLVGICPEMNNKFCMEIAWLYGPIACGAFVVLIVFFILLFGFSNSIEIFCGLTAPVSFANI